ncbi:acyl carrier protein [Actinomadura sp. 3N508]|uniref:acyl carrier protein n=1 Tax=Actinomadura sp. 3N508 TaxID=3375153 RepID=UPI00379E0DD5
MSETQVLQGIGEIVEDIIGVPAEGLTLDSHLVDDRGLDSLAMVELGFALEDRFGVEIAEENIKDLVVVRDMVGYVIGRAASVAS